MKKFKKMKIKAFLFTKPYSDGKHPIYIRIYRDAKSNYVNTGYSINKEAWNEDKSEVWESIPSLTLKLKESLSKEEIKDFKAKQSNIKLLPNAEKINSEIRNKIALLEETYNILEINGKAFTPETLKNVVEKKDLIENSKKDFLVFIKDVADKKYLAKQIRTSEKYLVMLKKLKAFRKDKPLPIEDLTTKLLKEFELYLTKEGCHQNYVHVNLKALRTIIQKEAIKEEEERILSSDKNPFTNYTMPTIIPTKKEKLDLVEILRMQELQLEKESYIYHVRNAFIFSIYIAGIRIGDLMQLRWCNINEDGRLEYSMNKTGKIKSIKLLPQALKILSLYQAKKETDYIFPFLDNNATYSKLVSPEDLKKASPELLTHLFNKIESQISLYNRSLKIIAFKSKIKKKVSSHIARHSFAEIARNKVSIYEIQKMLGHTNIKITEGYLKSLNDNEMDNAMEEVFN
jgi:integrase/recombinase XerD